MSIDWTAVMLGGGVGLVSGAAFFAGLEYGLRFALRTQLPVRILAISSVLRIATLLIVGWIVVATHGPWAMSGFAITFLGARFVIIRFSQLGEMTNDLIP